MGIKPEDISLEEVPECGSLKVKVDFIEERTLYKAVYAKVEGLKEYIVFRAPHDAKVEAGKTINVYFSLDKVGLYDEAGNALKSREEIMSNSAPVKVTTKDNKTTVAIAGGQKLVYDNLNVDDGDYNMSIIDDKVRVVFNKKMAKRLNVEFVPAVKGQTLSFSCYDEEPVGSKNIVFGQIKGFADYVTIVTNNNFSVYKMPKFEIEVPSYAIQLKPLN